MPLCERSLLVRECICVLVQREVQFGCSSSIFRRLAVYYLFDLFSVILANSLLSVSFALLAFHCTLMNTGHPEQTVPFKGGISIQAEARLPKSKLREKFNFLKS